MLRWKLIAGIVLVFVLGVVAGSLGTGLFFQKRIDRFAMGPPPFHLMIRQATEGLALTEEQRQSIATIARETGERMQALGVIERQPDYDKLFDLTFVEKIKNKLNP